MAESARYREFFHSYCENLGIDSEILPQTAKPTCIIVLGQRGSGKTTFVQNLVQEFYIKGFPFVINLDPGCEEVPYPPNIDIRDTMDYRDIMKGFDMNVNDGMVTALNIYSTKINDLIDYIQTDGETHEYIVVDAPGLKEMFAWWACGKQVTRAFGSNFPTIIVYLIDSEDSTDPLKFMSNIMYLYTIMHAVKLPFIVTMNKIDLTDHKYAVDWLHDSKAFWEALCSTSSDCGDVSFATLASIFRQVTINARICGVSASTGEGIPSFLEHLHSIVDAANALSLNSQAARQAFEEFPPPEPHGQLMNFIMPPLNNEADEKYIETMNKRRQFSQDLEAVVNTASFQDTLQLYKKILEMN